MMFLQYFSSIYEKKHHTVVDHTTRDFQFEIKLNNKLTYQNIIGFGGAFTEAAAFTLEKVNANHKANVIDSYYNKDTGLNYTIGRVHINSCDFSLGNYDYVDENDINLDSFDINREYQYVIPLIKKAEKKAGRKIPLLASPWSPPSWMKSNNQMNNGGYLLPKFYQAWANYYVKFIDEFKKADLTVAYVSVQNEPAAIQTWDSCIYTAEQERDFIKNYLGPTLRKAHPEVKIVIWDHNRDIVVERGDTVLKDSEARDYVWGTGLHWYVSEEFSNLTKLHNLHPDKHILFTEGCIEGGVKLGSYETGERYARNMIGDFRNYCEGYLDWNIVLNEQGGPNHVGNYCDAPIICDTQTDKIHKNSSYYYIGHFSKHIQPGSVRIESNSDNENLKNVAFRTPDNKTVLVVLNESEESYKVKLNYLDSERNVLIKPRSISTFIKQPVSMSRG